MPQNQPQETQSLTFTNGVAPGPGGGATRNNAIRPFRDGGSSDGGSQCNETGTTKNAESLPVAEKQLGLHVDL